MSNLIKNIFWDIFMLYKNFIHFNISKILIFLVSILYWFVFFLPFALILFWIYYYINSTMSIALVWANFYLALIYKIAYVLWMFFAFWAFSYYFVLLIKLDLKYIKQKKLELKKNYYFDLKLFFKYFKLFLLNFLIVFTPFLILIVILSILIFFLGWVSNVNQMIINSPVNSFSIISLVLFIITFLSIIYLSYRTLFSVVILVDEYKKKKLEKVTYYIKKSFLLTKWFKKIFRFFVVFTLVLLFSLPVVIPNNFLSQKAKEISDYLYITNNRVNLNDFDYKYLDYLQKKYSNKNSLVLQKEFKKTLYLSLFFKLLYFLFIVWLFEMFLVSFYKRELKK